MTVSTVFKPKAKVTLVLQGIDTNYKKCINNDFDNWVILDGTNDLCHNSNRAS